MNNNLTLLGSGSASSGDLLGLIQSGWFSGSTTLAQAEAPTIGAAPAATPSSPATTTELVGQPKAAGGQNTAVQQAPGGGSTPAAPANPGGLGLFPVIIAGLMVFMLFSVFTAPRKEKKRQAAMMASLATNDKVMTAGGIIGTVAEIRDDEVVLRVDESSNSRVRFAKSAIQQVLRRSGAAGVAEAKPAGQKVGA